MTRRTIVVALVGGAAFVAPALGQHAHEPAGGVHVTIGFADFQPTHLDVARGETVHWSNDSVRRHTVTADDGSFDSGTMLADSAFENRFDGAGVHRYSCRLHAGMVGEVAVHAAVLDPPAAAGSRGRPLPLTGRAPAGSTVVIEEERDGTFHPVARGDAEADGRFTISVAPDESTRYRPAVGGEAGPPVQVLVVDRTIRAAGVRRGSRVFIRARVAPAAPDATLVLQRRLKERFGWWPVRVRHLDGSSGARFVLRTRRAVHARVVLTLGDGATQLALSDELRVPRLSPPRVAAG